MTKKEKGYDVKKEQQKREEILESIEIELGDELESIRRKYAISRYEMVGLIKTVCDNLSYEKNLKEIYGEKEK